MTTETLDPGCVTKPSDPLASPYHVPYGIRRRLEATPDSAYPVAAIRDWILSVREVAEADLYEFTRKLRSEFAEFERYGIYPGVRHTTSLEEKRAKLETLRNIETAITNLLRDVEELPEDAA